MKNHLGKILRQLLKEKSMTAKQLGGMIDRDYRSVCDMFRRQHLNTELLEKISQALNHDMFQYLYDAGSSPADKKLQEKLSELEKQIQQLQTENGYLKEIVRLQKK